MPRKRPRADSPSVANEEEEDDDDDDDDDGDVSAPDADESEEDTEWHNDVMEHEVNAVWLTRDLYTRCVEHFQQEDWDYLGFEELGISEDDDDDDIYQQIRNEAEHRLEKYEKGEDDEESVDGAEEQPIMSSTALFAELQKIRGERYELVGRVKELERELDAVAQEVVPGVVDGRRVPVVAHGGVPRRARLAVPRRRRHRGSWSSIAEV